MNESKSHDSDSAHNWESQDIGLFRRGDSQAFTRIWTPIRPNIFATCYANTEHYDDAQDLCQTTALQVMRYIRTKETEIEDFKAFCFTVAFRRIKDYFRKARRDPLKSAVELSFENEPEILCGNDQKLANKIQRILNALSDKDRDLITQYHLQGKTRLSIADTRGVSRRRIGQILRRIYEDLRKQFSAEAI